MKKAIKWSGVAAALTALGIFLWSRSEPPSLIGETDPAVAYINATLSDSEQPFRDFFYAHEGQSLHVVESGWDQPEAILFVHGFPSFWYSFVHQLRKLKSQYRVIAVDGLGAGLSSTPPELSHYQQEAMTQHILSLMDSLDIERFHLVGHDWGSVLVLGIAQHTPERVMSVTGISAPAQNILLNLLKVDADQHEKSRYVATFKSANPVLLKLFNIPNRIFEGAYQPLVESGNLTESEGLLFRNATSDVRRINAHLNWYRANLPDIDQISETDYWPSREAQFTTPTLLVFGNDDPSFTPAYLQATAKVGNDVEILTFDGVGHWPHVERAERVTDAISKLIAGQQNE